MSKFNELIYAVNETALCCVHFVLWNSQIMQAKVIFSNINFLRWRKFINSFIAGCANRWTRLYFVPTVWADRVVEQLVHLFVQVIVFLYHLKIYQCCHVQIELHYWYVLGFNFMRYISSDSTITSIIDWTVGWVRIISCRQLWGLMVG